MLYLNVDGLSNLAIAEGTVCRFTRVVGSGLEAWPSELAERRGIALADARARLAEGDLTAPAGARAGRDPEPVAAEPEREEQPSSGHEEIPEPEPIDLSAEAQGLPSAEEHEAASAK